MRRYKFCPLCGRKPVTRYRRIARMSRYGGVHAAIIKVSWCEHCKVSPCVKKLSYLVLLYETKYDTQAIDREAARLAKLKLRAKSPGVSPLRYKRAR